MLIFLTIKQPVSIQTALLLLGYIINTNLVSSQQMELKILKIHMHSWQTADVPSLYDILVIAAFRE